MGISCSLIVVLHSRELLFVGMFCLFICFLQLSPYSFATSTFSSSLLLLLLLLLLSSYKLRISHKLMLAGSIGIGFIPHVINVKAGEVEILK